MHAGEMPAPTGVEQVSTRTEDVKNRYFFISENAFRCKGALYYARRTVGTAGYVETSFVETVV